MQISRLKKKPTFLDLSDGLDDFIDSLYLSESIWSYIDDASGSDGLENSDCTNYEVYISVFSFFAVLGLLKAYSNVFRKDFDLDQDCIKKNYQIFRDTISAIKNGRHAVENVAQLQLISLGKKLSPYSFLTPVGGVAVGVGVLLCVSNFFRNKYIRQREFRLEKYKKIKALDKGVEVDPSFNIYERENIRKDIEELRSKRCNAKLLLSLGVFHSLTDALYQVGNAYMLLTLVGVAASGPVGVGGLASAYFLYSMSLMVSNYYDERKKQLDEELMYYKVVYDGDDKLEKINKAQDNIDRFNSSNIARMVVLMAGIRRSVNHFKNNLAAVMGVDVLISKVTLKECKKQIAIKIIGGSLGCMFCLKSGIKFVSKNNILKNIDNSVKYYQRNAYNFFNNNLPSFNNINPVI
jgi:hypothetical protein